MFYHEVNSNILDNFPYNDIVATVARVLITLNILISVPYGCFMPRVSLYHTFNCTQSCFSSQQFCFEKQDCVQLNMDFTPLDMHSSLFSLGRSR